MVGEVVLQTTRTYLSVRASIRTFNLQQSSLWDMTYIPDLSPKVAKVFKRSVLRARRKKKATVALSAPC